jgi:hypothetical protein
MRIKTITLFFAAVLLFFFFTGCDRAEQKTTPPAQPPQVETPAPAPVPSTLPEITEVTADDIIEPEHGDIIDTTDEELNLLFEGSELELELPDAEEEPVELLDFEESVNLEDLEGAPEEVRE